MTREELKKIAMRYAHNELKDSQSPIEDVVAAAFLDGIDYAGQHQWISVEDELPPRGRTDPNVSVPVITCKIVNRELHEIGFQQYIFGKGKWKYCDATHWMPLPQAPHHIIDANKKVDRVIGTADHIKTALDVLNKKGGEE